MMVRLLIYYIMTILQVITSSQSMYVGKREQQWMVLDISVIMKPTEVTIQNKHGKTIMPIYV
jgi:hypothetical protein